MEKEIITFSRSGPSLVARISCEIDHHTAGRLRTRIDRELFVERPQVLRLDFGEVRFMDSSGIALILGRVEKASTLHISVRLCGASPTIMKLIRLGGLERVKNLTVIK